VRVADELRHHDHAAEHEDAVEDALTHAAEIEQRGSSAQEPAKAAPNTSAPIRMAALTTVTTLIQTMRRD